MLPASCSGCPYYGPDKDIVRDTQVEGAEVHIIQTAPNWQACKTGRADVSDIQKGIRLAGLEKWSLGHVVRCKIPAKPVGNPVGWEKKYAAAARHCAQYANLPDLPIVVVGKDAWNALTGKSRDTDIYMWRGFRYDLQED